MKSFENWLKMYQRKNGAYYKEKSVSNYFGGFITISNEMVGLGVISKPLETMTRSEFEYYKAIILKNPSFVAKNTSGDKMYSRSLDLYSEYLKYITGGWIAPKPVYQTIVFGDDVDGPNIRYADDVKPSERVPGLVAFLEEEYEKILNFTHGTRLDILKNYHKIPVILSKKKPIEIYENDDATIEKLINRRHERHINEIPEEEIKDMWNLRKMVIPVWGNYFSNDNDPYIEIYYTNISCRDLDDYSAKISSCLAHVFFYYLMDIDVVGKNCLTADKKTIDIIDSSLASFFSVLYLTNRRYGGDPNVESAKISYAEEMYDSWDRLFGSSWPYANALWFYFIGFNWLPFEDDYNRYLVTGSFDKFKAVMDITSTPIKDAYEEAYKELKK